MPKGDLCKCGCGRIVMSSHHAAEFAPGCKDRFHARCRAIGHAVLMGECSLQYVRRLLGSASGARIPGALEERPGKTAMDGRITVGTNPRNKELREQLEAALESVVRARGPVKPWNTFTTDDVWERADELYGDQLADRGADRRVMGAVMTFHPLVREGTIEKTDRTQRSRRPMASRRPVAVWRIKG